MKISKRFRAFLSTALIALISSLLTATVFYISEHNICSEFAAEAKDNSFDVLHGFAKLDTKNKYYCVGIGQREMANIISTDYHEVAHFLVLYNHEHFCEQEEYSTFKLKEICENLIAWQEKRR